MPSVRHVSDVIASVILPTCLVKFALELEFLLNFGFRLKIRPRSDPLKLSDLNLVEKNED